MNTAPSKSGADHVFRLNRTRSAMAEAFAPVRPPRNGDRKGEVREHCLSPRRGRVAQRPFRSSTAGKCEAPAHLGRLFFGYFLLAKQKKVTCCRATPGEVDLPGLPPATQFLR